VQINRRMVADHENGRGATQYLPHFLISVVYLFAGVRFFLLIYRYSVNILGWDQWDFDDATLFQHHSLWEMFCWQNGPHRQGLGAIFQVVVDPLIHWNSRYEALAVGCVIFVAALLGLLLKIRLYGSVDYWDVVIPLLFLTPLQYETLVAATNPAHGPLPLLLVVVYCSCWTIRNYRWKCISILLSNFVLIYTGFGIFIGIVTPALLALDFGRNARNFAAGRRRWSAGAMAISLASLASFFVHYRLQSSVDCFSSASRSPSSYLRFAALMFAHVAGLRIPSLTLASILGLVVLFWILAGVSLAVKRMFTEQSETWPRDSVIAALLVYGAIFCLSTAYGRLCLGLQSASSSRYTEYVILGYFGLYLCALSISNRNLRDFLVLILLVLSLFSARRLNRIDAGGLAAISNGKRAWRECYLSRHDIKTCNDLTHFQIYSDPAATHLQEKLDFLERNHLNLYEDDR
jgi:hypothetical protein